MEIKVSCARARACSLSLVSFIAFITHIFIQIKTLTHTQKAEYSAVESRIFMYTCAQNMYKQQSSTRQIV